MKVQVDKSSWVEPDAVDAVTPGGNVHVVRLHLRSGSVVAVNVGPEHLCPDIAAVVALLFTPLNKPPVYQPPPLDGWTPPPLDGWTPPPLGGGPSYTTNDDPMRRDMQDDIGYAQARIARDTQAYVDRNPSQ